MPTQEEYELILSAISHEIRNPVTLINSYLQLMASAHPEVQKYDQWKPVQGEMDYLKELLGEISAYHNSSHLQMTAVDLNLWFSEYECSARTLIDSLWAAKISSAEITPGPCPGIPRPVFRLERPPHLPVIYIDPVKLRQVLDNLLRNSVEATGPRPNEITLSVRTMCLPPSSASLPRPDAGQGFGTCHMSKGRMTQGVFEKPSSKRTINTLEIRISDTGCGIAPEHLDTLFQPFVSHKPGGTGLGLSMAERIVRAHGGTFSVASTPGLGTQMILSLPLR